MAYTTNKTLNVRIKNKYDSYENWVASSVILEAGEIAIAHTLVDSGIKDDKGVDVKHPALLMKVGDGSSSFAALPWLSAKAADVLEACKDETALTAFVNSVIADAGIASDEAMEALAGRVTTAEGKITTLEGEMDAAEGRIKTAEDAIDALEALVGDTKVELQINAAIEALNLAGTYEAKGEAAKVSEALEAYKGTNDIAVKGNADAIAAIKKDATITTFKGIEDAIAGIEQAAAAYATKDEAQGYANAKDDDIAAAKKAGDDAQAGVDALNAKVDLAEGETVTGLIGTAKEEAMAHVTEVNGRLGALEGLVGDTKVETQIAGAVAAEAEIARAAEKANADAIGILNGNSSVDGSVDKKVADAINEFATQLTDDNVYNTYAELINYAATHGSEFTELVGEVDANTKAIATLNGDNSTVGSVDKKIADAIAGENLGQYAKDADLQNALTRIGTAEGDIDTLEGKMSTAEGKISTAEGKISALEGLVGDTKVETQIGSAIEALNLDTTYAKASDLEATQGEVDALEEKVDALKIEDLGQTADTYIVFDCGTASTLI